MRGDKRAVLIAGPTASGKSALALDYAGREGGIVVNADSMQVYDGLRLITARPGDEELARAEHRLYGFVDPATRFSTGAWLAEVHKVIQDHDPSLGPLIFVGGTGLYFDALINGVADIPAVPDAVAAEADRQIAVLDREQRAALLAQEDPEMVPYLKEPDPQRLARALSVKRATGTSLAVWQQRNQRGYLEGWDVRKLVLNPDRDVLRERIARRFEQMVRAGAADEVEALLARNLDKSLPVMKAIGVREIGAWLKGDMSQADAVEKSIIATHQYAKRQRTWFRGRFGDWQWRDGNSAA